MWRDGHSRSRGPDPLATSVTIAMRIGHFPTEAIPTLIPSQLRVFAAHLAWIIAVIFRDLIRLNLFHNVATGFEALVPNPGS